jgi:HEAT repeat protein
MPGQDLTMNPEAAVDRLEEAFLDYGSALAQVVHHQEAAVPALIAALGNRKTATAAASALGYLMHLPGAVRAIRPLLGWLKGQNAVYPEAVNALVRAGSRVVPFLLAELWDAAEREDDETVRNLFDLGSKLPDESYAELLSAILSLLTHRNRHIRGVATDAIWRLGLPDGRPAIPILQSLAADDPDEDVRESATEALIRLGAIDDGVQ